MTKTVPNNPYRAYLVGKLDGTRENMDIVCMVLCDKMGFHVREQTEDEHDRHSIEYLYNQVEETVKEINSGRISRRSIKDMIEEEYKVRFDGEGRKHG